MKKFFILFIISSVLILTACNKEEHNILVCENGENKFVLNINEENNIDSIYYESIYDFNNYYTEEQIDEIKNSYGYLSKILEDVLYDCNKTDYSCESIYKNEKIVNKKYVSSKKESISANLDDYYGIDATDARTKLVQNENVTCKIQPYNDKYEFNEHKTNIVLDKTYLSLDELMQEINKPNYFRKYDLIQIEDKKATIEFKEDNKCIIDLSQFNQEIWGGSYCDNEKHKEINYITYNGGNCTYTIKDDYRFYINYDGTYTTGKYCGTKDNNKNKQDGNVTNREMIIEFDNNYNNFEYYDGMWKKYSHLSPVIYK